LVKGRGERKQRCRKKQGEEGGGDGGKGGHEKKKRGVKDGGVKGGNRKIVLQDGVVVSVVEKGRGTVKNLDNRTP